jgi:hypothetical protein
MRLNRIFAAMLVLGLSNCASITTGTTQVVSVETTPVQGATCELSNEKGTWNIPNTPGSTTVTRADGDLSVLCTYRSGAKGLATARSVTQASALGNVLLGGILGATIDMADGAAYRYPSLITVHLTSMVSEDDAMLVQCVNQVSMRWSSRATCRAGGGLPAEPIQVMAR